MHFHSLASATTATALSGQTNGFTDEGVYVRAPSRCRRLRGSTVQVLFHSHLSGWTFMRTGLGYQSLLRPRRDRSSLYAPISTARAIYARAEPAERNGTN